MISNISESFISKEHGTNYIKVISCKQGNAEMET